MVEVGMRNWLKNSRDREGDADHDHLFLLDRQRVVGET